MVAKKIYNNYNYYDNYMVFSVIRQRNENSLST